MATAITPITPIGPYLTDAQMTAGQPTATTLNFAFTAGDVAGNTVAFDNDLLLVVTNTSGGAAGTFTLTSVGTGDPFNRTRDVTAYSLGDALFAVFRIKAPGWKNSSGVLTITPSATTMKFAAFKLG